MTLELLYLPGCPNHGVTMDLVHTVLRAEGVPVEIDEIPIHNVEDAFSYAFPGSPTIRVNGQDIENIPSDQLAVGLACRTYLVKGRPQGVPPRCLLEQAVHTARELEGRQ
jgi:hypothetical protein